ncbi:MAG: hypothetical protein OXC98_11455 [bacterium]|nr:hypothetical protein [Acidimicrobiia bacterium]MCY4650967.1 hypothetical protein [bacterium]
MQHSRCRPRPFPRSLGLASALCAFLLGATSCALFEPEESLSPTPTITAPVPDTAAEPVITSTTSLTTSTTQAPTTITSAVPETTSTTSPIQVVLDYLEQLLGTRSAIARLMANVEQINDDWDNRSQTGVSFSETELALEAAVQSAQTLQDDFVVIQAPSELGLRDEHRVAGSAVGILTAAPQEMLDGLRSPDTGQARRAALLGALTAFDLFAEVAARVAAIIGEEGIEMLEASTTDESAGRTDTPAPTTTSPESTTTSPESTTTTIGEAPPDPGNSRNCSDFSTQEEAQEWYDTYFPFYGDVAQLDTNENKLACEFLP